MPSVDCKDESKEKHQDGLCEGCMSQSNTLQSPWFPNSVLRADLCTPLVPSCNASSDRLQFCFPQLGGLQSQPHPRHLTSAATNPPRLRLACYGTCSRARSLQGHQTHCAAVLLSLKPNYNGREIRAAAARLCPVLLLPGARYKAASDVNVAEGTR